jgi:hypothetical protein
MKIQFIESGRKEKQKKRDYSPAGRNLTLLPFFSLSSPKGGEGRGKEVNCF